VGGREKERKGFSCTTTSPTCFGSILYSGGKERRREANGVRKGIIAIIWGKSKSGAFQHRFEKDLRAGQPGSKSKQNPRIYFEVKSFFETENRMKKGPEYSLGETHKNIVKAAKRDYPG